MNRPDNARRAYIRHRANAERRSIPFRLTFDEWWSIWQPHWHRRSDERLDMCRHADMGAYELGNVRIDTHDANMAEKQAGAARAALDNDLIACRLGSLPERIARFERRAVLAALKHTNGNVTQAAYRLGISFRQMRYLCKRHKVTRNDPK